MTTNGDEHDETSAASRQSLHDIWYCESGAATPG